MVDCQIRSHVQHVAHDKSENQSFITNFPSLLGTSAAFCHSWCTLLENHCSTHHAFVPPIDEQRHCNNVLGFVLGDYQNGEDVDYPVECHSRLNVYSALTHKGMMKDGTLPKEHKNWVCAHINQGHNALRELSMRFSPSLSDEPQSCTISPK